MFLNREDFFEEVQLQTDIVTLDSGKNVRISEITAPDYMELCEMCKLEEEEDGTMTLDIHKFNPLLMVYSIVDESGNRIFTIDDANQLSRMSKKPLTKIVDGIKRLNDLLGDSGNDSEPTEKDLNSGE